jgi:hypothetical protein
MRNAQKRSEYSKVPEKAQPLTQPRKPVQRNVLVKIRPAHSRSFRALSAMCPTSPDRIPTASRPAGCGAQVGRTHELERGGFPQTPGAGLPIPPGEEARWRHHAATQRNASSTSWQTPVQALTCVGMVMVAAAPDIGRSTSRFFPALQLHLSESRGR